MSADDRPEDVQRFTGLPLVLSSLVPPGQMLVTADAVFISEDEAGPISLALDGQDPGEPVTLTPPSRWHRAAAAIGRALAPVEDPA